MMMTRRVAVRLLLSAAVLGVAVSPAFAQPTPGHLDEVLRQMDAASAKFESAEADFQWELFEKVVNQTTTVQTGHIYFKKEGAKTVMGAKLLTPSVKILEYKDGVLRLFDPGTDHLTVVASKGNEAQMESFLTLGFGGSGRDLMKAWTISDMGMEMVDGIEAAKLDLVPKDPQVRNNCTHMTVWLDPSRGISLKQKFFMPSEDVRTAVYTNVRYNQGVNEKQYEIKTDGKTTRDQH